MGIYASPDNWRTCYIDILLLDVNFMLQGAFLITQAAGRSMLQNQIYNGSIVHISSIVAKVNLSSTCLHRLW